MHPRRVHARGRRRRWSSPWVRRFGGHEPHRATRFRCGHPRRNKERGHHPPRAAERKGPPGPLQASDEGGSHARRSVYHGVSARLRDALSGRIAVITTLSDLRDSAVMRTWRRPSSTACGFWTLPLLLRRPSYAPSFLDERDSLREPREAVRHCRRLLGETAIQIQSLRIEYRQRLSAPTQQLPVAFRCCHPGSPRERTRAQSHGSRRGFWALGARARVYRALDRVDPTAGLYIGESTAE